MYSIGLWLMLSARPFANDGEEGACDMMRAVQRTAERRTNMKQARQMTVSCATKRNSAPCVNKYRIGQATLRRLDRGNEWMDGWKYIDR